MSKDAYLEMLRTCLVKELPIQYVQPLLDYYGNYIDEETKKGYTENQITIALGAPYEVAVAIVEIEGGKKPVPPEKLMKYTYEGTFNSFRRKYMGFPTQDEAGYVLLACFVLMCVALKMLGWMLQVLEPVLLPMGIFVAHVVYRLLK